ncbi:MAG TPA: hypothetical protein VJH88_03840 [Candidatus Nanoarchaeia archaeon]|nr:hypothetical protein [Candidatus Nanoarchaeia archaeon]
MKQHDYSGKWIALREKVVVSSADDFNTLIEQLKAVDISALTFAKIPKRGTVCVM